MADIGFLISAAGPDMGAITTLVKPGPSPSPLEVLWRDKRKRLAIARFFQSQPTPFGAWYIPSVQGRFDEIVSGTCFRMKGSRK